MVVYVARTNIDIDDELVARAMQIHGLRTKREAVNLALLHLVGSPMDRSEALAMEGRGWGADLAELRAPDEPSGK
jgi:Arc/MetJ family transcription regulator